MTEKKCYKSPQVSEKHIITVTKSMNHNNTHFNSIVNYVTTEKKKGHREIIKWYLKLNSLCLLSPGSLFNYLKR